MTPAEYEREYEDLSSAGLDSNELADDDPDEIADDVDDGGPEPFYPYPFDESDCSGAWDGFGVVSDADPGL